MKAEIGYITAWRRAIFLTLIIDIILFGIVSTLASTRIGGIAANMVSVAALLFVGVITVLVVADKSDRFSGTGTAVIEDDRFVYNDRKRHLDIKLSDIKKVDIEKICMGRYDGPPTAYRILIATKRKKYYIESDRATGRNYTEMGINSLYMYINQAVNNKV